MTDAEDDKARRELDKQLALLAERATDQGEAQAEHPRGALPALFRAARAVPGERARVLGLLARRLPDLPLVEPTLQLAAEDDLPAAFAAAAREAAAGPDAYCALEQVAALEAVVGPRLVEALQGLLADTPWDPTALALDTDPARFAEALREVVRRRLQAPARRRDRTSAALARGALRALARIAPDDPALHATLAHVVGVETRRAGKDEPLLALEALDALAAAPPFAALRLLGPLLRAIDRPKVKARLEQVLEAAAAAAGVGREERAELDARAGGMEPDSRVQVALEEGDAFLSIDARGEVVREPAGALPGPDARAVEAATRELVAAREDLAARLEDAMLSGRAWAAPVWAAIFQGEHPLWRELAPRLLWALEGGGAFVVGERGPEDLFGERVEVSPTGRVTLVHPVQLPEDELELWRERSLDLAATPGGRRLVSPFPQLWRPVAATGDLARFVGREAHKQALGDVARLGGWRGFPLSGSSPWELTRTFAGGARATLVVEDVPVETKKLAPAALRRLTKDDDDDGDGAARRRRRERRPRREPNEAAPRVRLTAVSLEPAGASGVPLAETVLDLETLTDPLATVDELWLRTWQARRWQDEKEAWREVVLRYRLGSPALLAMRRALLAALARRAGLALRLEDRFAIAGQHVIELATGLVHHGPAKEHLPRWKVDELLGPAGREPPPGLPFEPAADPDTVEVVARVLAFARRG